MMEPVVRAGKSFQNFPPELLDNVFAFVDPLDLRPIALTCQKFYTRTRRNHVLFRRLYLRFLDAPNENDLSITDWEGELHKFVSLRRVLTSPSFDTVDKKVRRPEPATLFNFIHALTQTAHPNPSESLNIKFLVDHFRGNLANLEAFCCQSVNYERARRMSNLASGTRRSVEERQLSAKIHVYLGDPVRNLSRSTHARVYPVAASMVYDLRNYTEQTLWGPFKPDGNASVDWEKMEAIMIVLGENARGFKINEDSKLRPLWSYFWNGSTPNSFVSRNLECGEEVTEEPDFEDPYGITGSWMRVVSFLDFHELFHYNFTALPPQPHVPRPPLNTVEAVRLIMMELRATHKTDPGPEDGQNLPVVHFVGTARSLHASWDPNANSNIRGTVRETKEGEIRWTSLSVFNGEERWKSEAIQVGGPKSARGVLGHWFDKDWDQQGPAGPTAFWKISDQIDDRTKTSKKFEAAGMGEMSEVEVEMDEEEEDDEEAGVAVYFPNGEHIVVVQGQREADEADETDDDEDAEGESDRVVERVWLGVWGAEALAEEDDEGEEEEEEGVLTG